MIAGGGPAGLLAAARLGARYSVALIEAGSLGYTTRFWITTQRRLEKHGLAHCARYECESMLLGTYLGGQAEIYGDLVIVDEDMLLRDLVDRCKKVGVLLTEHCQLRSISWSRNRVHVGGTSKSFDSRLLVDCTGDSSPIASTFRPHRIKGFYSIIGAHLSPIKLRSRQIILSHVDCLGTPPFILEVAPTGRESAYCALYTYSRQLMSMQHLHAAFQRHCQNNSFFEIGPDTRSERGKNGAIVIGRAGRRHLPRVVLLGGAGLVQPPLLGSGFNEILEYSNRICDRLSLALDRGRTDSISTAEFYPLLTRAQNRLQLMLAERLLEENVEELDWLIRFVGTLSRPKAFNLCSNELTWTQLLSLVPRFLWEATFRRKDPPFI